MVPNGDKKSSSNLGVYLFRAAELDGKSVSNTIKIGYDPIAKTIEDKEPRAARSASRERREKLTAQEKIVLAYASEIYGVPQDKLAIVKSDTCSYPTDVTLSPVVGCMSEFHEIRVVGSLMGYGAMAGPRLVEQGLLRKTETEKSFALSTKPSVIDMFDPEIRITPQMKSQFDKVYGYLPLSGRAAASLGRNRELFGTHSNAHQGGKGSVSPGPVWNGR